MISFIKGIVDDVLEDRIVVENNGIGYNIFTSDAKKISPGQDVKMYTYLNVREDAMILYGFLSKEDLSLFRLMLGVNGIGPKAALNLLVTFSADEIRMAIFSSDSKLISKAPGIGKKTAERLIMELGDNIDMGMSISHDTQSVATDNKKDARNETIEALTSLVYSSSEAVKAVNAAVGLLGESADTEELLKASLKQMV